MLGVKVARAERKAAAARNHPARTSATLARDRLGRDAQEQSPLAWDLGHVPLFSPDRASRLDASVAATGRLPGILQAKLVVGSVNDPLEHEADRVAEQVMRMPEPASLSSAPAQLSRKCAACEEEEAQKLQTKPVGATAAVAEAPPIVHEVLRSRGQPLDPGSRAFFEPRFGRDFANVRAHTNTRAAASAAAIGASAYTYGPNIVFAVGRYEPNTSSGRRLLAHELTHVLQQGSNDRHLDREPPAVSDRSDAAEAEAHRAADEVVTEREPGSLRRHGALTAQSVSRTIQRQTCTPAEANEVPSGLNLSGFEQGSPILPGKYYPPLRTLALRLKGGGASGEVQVHGYASQEGDTAFNLRLSCARAFGVRQVIQANGASNPISLIAHGATMAVGTGADDNRAVIVVESAAQTPDEKKPETEKPKTDQPDEGPGLTPTKTCAPDSSCPPEYCEPFAIQQEAEDDRARERGLVLSLLPNGRARPLFEEFIDGGGAARDISAQFAKDFTNSETTNFVTGVLMQKLTEAVKAKLPAFPPNATSVTVDIKDVLDEKTLNEIMEKMSFTNVAEVPGLIAGGIGKNQAKCQIGHTTTAQDDVRLVEGTVKVTKEAAGAVSVSPLALTYTVQDTLDFCPGNCGSGAALKLTVPLSRWEATGISGDVPFTVKFPPPTGAALSEE